MINFACVCGKVLRARDELAGKKTRCSACSTVLWIPEPEGIAAAAPDPEFEDDSPYGLMEAAPPAGPVRSRAIEEDEDEDEAVPERSGASTYRPAPRSEPSSRFPTAPTRTKATPAVKPARAIQSRPGGGGERSILEYSYLLLFFALVPLMFSLLGQKDPAELADRIQRTIDNAPAEDRPKITGALGGESMSLDDIINALPGGKLAGAHLARNTSTHWIYATIAAAAYLLLLGLCFSVERAKPWHLVGIGAFTATAGIAFLLFVQVCANVRFGGIRGRGIGLIIMLILVFIGWSYASAEDPNSNFFLSAFGFTFGVGLCEEFTKAIPIFFAFRRHCDLGWRTACLWGLASGIGFGVAEGVMYSVRYYNGISGGDIYLVRFVSCVALHAMWSASVGIAVARNVDAYEGVEDAMGFGLFMIRVMAVPMVLHGFYDTLLKQDMNAYALLVAVLSFGWLSWHIELARGSNPAAGRFREPKKWAY